MTRKITIFLLILAFQSNVFAGMLMASDIRMSPMDHDHASMGMPDKNRAPDHCGSYSKMHHSNDCESSHQEVKNCEKHNNCGLCGGHLSKAILSNDLFVSGPSQFEFILHTQIFGMQVIHLPKLKPPKLI